MITHQVVYVAIAGSSSLVISDDKYMFVLKFHYHLSEYLVLSCDDKNKLREASLDVKALVHS